MLEGKVAIVTGSGRGIGREIALLLAAEGAKVVVNDLGIASDGSGDATPVADEVVAEIRSNGGEAVANYASVVSADSAESIIQTALDAFGGLDILVNNAGIMRNRMLHNMSDVEWDDVVKVHLYGQFYCTRPAIRQMREAIRAGRQIGGRVINLTSHAGILGNVGEANYAAAKAGVIGFTYTVAKENERLGITCNAVAPHAMTRLASFLSDGDMRKEAKRRGMAGWDAPDIADVKRAFLGGGPEAVAPLIAWLASEQSQYVNGEVFTIAGGKLGRFQKVVEQVVEQQGLFSIAQVAEAVKTLLPE